MKATIKVRPNLTIELEEDKQIDLFVSLASAQEVFSENCGKCKSQNIKFVVRKKDKSTFLELHCQDCGAKVPISPHDDKAGTIYVKRYEKDKETEKLTWLPNNGWQKWNPSTKKME